MKSKIWIGNMSEADKALAFKAVQKLDSFYNKRTVDHYDCFFIRSETDVWNGGSIDYYKESELPEITLQQLLKLAGMEENMSFTKADLVAGKHVVKFKDETEGLHLYLSDGILADTTGFAVLDYMNEDLSCESDDGFTIVAVYEIIRGFNLSHLSEGDRMKLVWERTPPKTETLIQFEKLQQQIAELQEQANKLKDTL